jgi:hypothetical protein
MSPRVKEAAGTNPLSVLGEALESAAETFGDATVNARATAKVAARHVKAGLSIGAYKSAYGISYGVVFGAVFLNELLPEGNVIRRGFEEGAEAGLEAVAVRRVKGRSAPIRSIEGKKKSVAAKPRQRISVS